MSRKYHHFRQAPHTTNFAKIILLWSAYRTAFPKIPHDSRRLIQLISQTLTMMVELHNNFPKTPPRQISRSSHDRRRLKTTKSSKPLRLWYSRPTFRLSSKSRNMLILYGQPLASRKVVEYCCQIGVFGLIKDFMGGCSLNKPFFHDCPPSPKATLIHSWTAMACNS